MKKEVARIRLWTRAEELRMENLMHHMNVQKPMEKYQRQNKRKSISMDCVNKDENNANVKEKLERPCGADEAVQLSVDDEQKDFHS